MINLKICVYTFLLTSLLPISATAQVNQENTSSTPERGIKYVAPQRKSKEQIQFFQGIAIGVDLVGPLMYGLGSSGQLEGLIRLNLKERFFPVAELGVGMCDETNEETGLHFKTKASPYIRIGCDYNFCKHPETKNRIFGGLRVGHSSFKSDLNGPNLIDPVWHSTSTFSFSNLSNSATWLEIVFGVEAKIWKNLHIGWNGRYRRKLRQDDPNIGEAWYVPGFGQNGSHNFGGTFNLVFDI